MSSGTTCDCFDPQARFDVFRSDDLGVDTADGRFGEVALLTCRYCGRRWLRYFVEYESQTGSGRWFRGLITAAAAHDVSARDAVRIMGELPWLFYGGSFFNTAGARMDHGLSSVSLHP